MRLTKLMGFAVVLVAMAVAVNALAFRTAVVTNGMSMTVDTTSASGLAFAAATVPDPGVSSVITDGKLIITVNDKMQPDSIYTYEDVVKITNNSGATVTLSYSTAGLTGGTTLALKTPANADISGTTLASATSLEVKMVVTVPSTFVTNGGTLAAAQSGSIIITATR